MKYIFYNCISLVALYISNFYMSHISIEAHIFYNMENMHRFQTNYSDNNVDNNYNLPLFKYF